MFHLLMNKRNSWLVLWETFSYVETFFIKFNKEIQASLVLKARQVINFADWCLMTSFMLSCVDAGLMTHSKCNDNDVAGVLPTLQLQIMMALLPRKHNGITCYSHEIMKFSLLKSGVPQITFTDPVLYIARHCILSNRCWCMSHPYQ